MPKQQTDHLLQLICSLSKAEKRHFRLFARRNHASDNILFLQLFDVIDKQQDYREASILQKIPQIKKRQLSNLKAHLYRQLLISLRMVNKNYNIDIEIREQVDYARVLYNKGLYRASLDMLNRTKIKALKRAQNALALEVLDFEKLIESQYITRSIGLRADKLVQEADEITAMMTKSQAFSNLSIQLYGLFLKKGYVKNEADFHFVRTYFQQNLPPFVLKELDFYGKIYYFQSFIWYYYLSQDFPQCYRYAQKWVDLFDEDPQMILVEAPLYLKGLHSLLNALFNLRYFDKFAEVFAQLETFQDRFPIQQVSNIEGLFNLYHYIHSIKKHFLEGTFRQGLSLVPDLMETIRANPYNWDDHRILLFYYRIACMYFGSGDFEQAIDYLNRIINQKTPDYREDIQCFSRILNLIAHFELGNEQLLEYQVKSVYRFLLKMKDLQRVQEEIFRFLRKSPSLRKSDLPEAFRKLKDQLLLAGEDPFERRPFLYLDIISWLESKITDRPVQEIVHEKFLERT